MHWCEDVLFSRLNGVFNAEAMHAYWQTMRQVLGDRATPWARFVDLRTWEGMTPEAQLVVKEISLWVRTTEWIATVQLFRPSFEFSMGQHAATSVAHAHLHLCTDLEESLRQLERYAIGTRGLRQSLGENR